MNRISLLVAITCFWAAGCTKQNELKLPTPQKSKAVAALPQPGDETTAPAPNAPVIEAARATAASAATEPVAQSNQEVFRKATPRVYEVNGKIDLEALTETFREYCAGYDKVPADINELVTSHYLPGLPTPPAGMKFFIERSDNSVRLVNK